MGMLTDEQMPVSEESAPVEDPSASPKEEQPPEQEAANVDDDNSGPPKAGSLPEKFEGIKSKAISFMYGKKFKALIKMFQDSGAEGFPRSVAVAVNGAINHVKESEDIDHRMSAVLGMDLYLKVVEDMATGEVGGMPILDDLTMEQVQNSLTETIKMYAESNEDVTEQDMQALLQEIQKQQGEQNGIA